MNIQKQGFLSNSFTMEIILSITMWRATTKHWRIFSGYSWCQQAIKFHSITFPKKCFQSKWFSLKEKTPENCMLLKSLRNKIIWGYSQRLHILTSKKEWTSSLSSFIRKELSMSLQILKKYLQNLTWWLYWTL